MPLKMVAKVAGACVDIFSGLNRPKRTKTRFVGHHLLYPVLGTEPDLYCVTLCTRDGSRGAAAAAGTGGNLVDGRSSLTLCYLG